MGVGYMLLSYWPKCLAPWKPPNVTGHWLFSQPGGKTSFLKAKLCYWTQRSIADVLLEASPSWIHGKVPEGTVHGTRGERSSLSSPMYCENLLRCGLTYISIILGAILLLWPLCSCGSLLTPHLCGCYPVCFARLLQVAGFVAGWCWWLSCASSSKCGTCQHYDCWSAGVMLLVEYQLHFCKQLGTLARSDEPRYVWSSSCSASLRKRARRKVLLLSVCLPSPSLDIRLSCGISV